MKLGDAIEFRGETKTVAEWGECTGIGGENVLARLRRQYSVERALTQPLAKKPTHKVFKGKEYKLKKTDMEKRFNEEERVQFFTVFDPEKKHFGKWADRNKGICLFLMHTGMRLSELCSLRIYDLSNGNGGWKRTLDVRAETAKNKKNRQIILNTEAHRALDLIIGKVHRDLNDKLIDISPRQVRDMVAKASIRAGLNRILSPHNLRHEFISRLYEKTHDVKIAQTLAGHASPQTTMSIYTHATHESLSKAVDSLVDG